MRVGFLHSLIRKEEKLPIDAFATINDVELVLLDDRRLVFDLHSRIDVVLERCINHLRGERIDIKPGQHGSTFSGNPLACSAALAAIHFMETENLANRAADLGGFFVERFGTPWPPIVRSVRQIGLMIGIELKERAQRHLVRLLKLGVLALPAGPTVIRLLPPLVISDTQLDRAA